MKSTLKVLFLFVLLAGLAFGQANTLVSTTLSAAVAKTDSVINLTSATGVSSDPQTLIYVEQEAMRVQSVSGTAITVARGTDGTAQVAHSASKAVYIGRPDWFGGYDRTGACTIGDEFVNPFVNVKNGSVWSCVSSEWVAIRGPATRGTGLTSLAPSTTGIDIATALLPFRNLYLGTAATSNFVFTPAATGAARVITIPDPGGAATLPWLNPTTAQTMSNTILNAKASTTAAASINVATGTAPTTSVAGDVWHDSTRKTLTFAPVATAVSYVSGTLYADAVTVVTATNPASIADLKTFTLPAGVLNAAGKTVRVCGGGLYNTAAGQTPTLTLTYALAGVAPAAIVSAATTASASNMPWQSCADFITVTAGASGTVETGGAYLKMVLVTTPAAAAAQYLATNTAVSSAFDQTATAALKMRATFSSSDAGNSVVQRWMTVELLN